jgi:hypothetical protein
MRESAIGISRQRAGIEYAVPESSDRNRLLWGPGSRLIPRSPGGDGQEGAQCGGRGLSFSY